MRLSRCNRSNPCRRNPHKRPRRCRRNRSHLLECLNIRTRKLLRDRCRHHKCHRSRRIHQRHRRCHPSRHQLRKGLRKRQVRQVGSHHNRSHPLGCLNIRTRKLLRDHYRHHKRHRSQRIHQCHRRCHPSQHQLNKGLHKRLWHQVDFHRNRSRLQECPRSHIHRQPQDRCKHHKRHRSRRIHRRHHKRHPHLHQLHKDRHIPQGRQAGSLHNRSRLLECQPLQTPQVS